MIYDVFLRSDMLCSRKVKLHGMSTTRWTTKDKLIQYKGLINLYRRDKKVAIIDKNVSVKRDRNTIETLKRKIAVARFDLDNFIFGDREVIRQALKEKQLPYQDLHADKILEHVSQNNFHYRKQLDLLHYSKVVKSNTLVKLKLKVAELQDTIARAEPDQLPIEVHCKVLTAQVHDANLKKEATIVINESYKKIISVCRKDAIYFDVILASLREDRTKQGKCILNAIILGQLATEYLADRKKEFQVLEKMVKQDMEAREKVLAELVGEVKRYSRKLKFLVRRDSDITLPVKKEFTNVDIRVQMRNLSKMLDILKDSFYTNNYSELISCLHEQRRQEERLKQLEEIFTEGRDVLLNKIAHVHLRFDEIRNTMIETTFEYKHTKKWYKDQILEKIKKINESRQLQAKKCDLIVRIKCSLQHMEQACKCVKDPFEMKRRKVKQDSQALVERDALNIKENCLELIDVLLPKVMLLTVNAIQLRSNLERDFAQMNLETLVLNRTKVIHFEDEEMHESLVLDDIKIESSSIPNRADIKAKSKSIVKINTKNDDLIPVYCVTPRRRKKTTLK